MLGKRSCLPGAKIQSWTFGNGEPDLLEDDKASVQLGSVIQDILKRVNNTIDRVAYGKIAGGVRGPPNLESQ